jgi:hypothetical protein
MSLIESCKWLMDNIAFRVVGKSLYASVYLHSFCAHGNIPGGSATNRFPLFIFNSQLFLPRQFYAHDGDEYKNPIQGEFVCKLCIFS